jgi:nitrate reductase NapE component
MVNWREVERLRSRGLDWETVAAAPSVQFLPPDGVEDAGRALKTLYLTRKSQRSRSSRGGSLAAEEEAAAARAPARLWSSRLFPVGTFLAVAAAVWSIVAVAFPAPYGIVVPFLPDLLLGLLLGAALLIAAFLLGVSDLRGAWTKPVAVGIVLGLIGVGLSGFVASQEGYLSLAPGTPYGNGFQQAANALWTENGRPVVFFMGSAACPYCSSLISRPAIPFMASGDRGRIASAS